MSFKGMEGEAHHFGDEEADVMPEVDDRDLSNSTEIDPEADELDLGKDTPEIEDEQQAA